MWGKLSNHFFFLVNNQIKAVFLNRQQPSLGSEALTSGRKYRNWSTKWVTKLYFILSWWVSDYYQRLRTPDSRCVSSTFLGLWKEDASCNIVNLVIKKCPRGKKLTFQRLLPLLNKHKDNDDYDQDLVTLKRQTSEWMLSKTGTIAIRIILSFNLKI